MRGHLQFQISNLRLQIQTPHPRALPPGRRFAGLVAAAVAATAVYGSILDRYTDAYAPFIDSIAAVTGCP